MHSSAMDTPFAPNLDAYFARIGYTGPRTPTVATLSALLLRHISSIPFENLDVLLGKTISLDPAVIERKLIHDQRGGYCYEQNTYFATVLRDLGFPVETLIARVRWNRPAHLESARTHMILRVEAEGRPWLVDVGFGSLGITAPLAFDVGDVEQSTPHEPRRLLQRGVNLVHQVRFGTEWHDIFLFTPEAVPVIDFELANWWSNQHPRSHFQQNLIATLVTPDGRLIILNRELTKRFPDGRTEKTPIESHAALLALLAEHYGLHFPVGTRFEAPASPWPAGM
jgi:N-hydroxyarylamine O-acetyltransferase